MDYFFMGHVSWVTNPNLYSYIQTVVKSIKEKAANASRNLKNLTSFLTPRIEAAVTSEYEKQNGRTNTEKRKSYSDNGDER